MLKAILRRGLRNKRGKATEDETEMEERRKNGRMKIGEAGNENEKRRGRLGYIKNKRREAEEAPGMFVE